MKCPECGKGEVEMQVEAFAYYKVAEDGSIDYRKETRVWTSDGAKDRTAICNGCGTKFDVDGKRVLKRKSRSQL